MEQQIKSRRSHDWPKIISSWKQSGKNVKDYCLETGIYKSDFYRMRKRLSTAAESKFVKITDGANQKKKSSIIILETPQKYRLELRDDFPAETIKQILRILAGLECS